VAAIKATGGNISSIANKGDGTRNNKHNTSAMVLCTNLWLIELLFIALLIFETSLQRDD
jgi:hypothetical protein